MLRRTALIGNILFVKNGSRATCGLMSVSASSPQCKYSTKSGPNSATKIDRLLCVKNSSRPSFYFVKTYCSTAAKEEDPNIATYEEVKNINSHPEKILIDVREPEELKETGQIPFSINIPLRQLEAAFTNPTNMKEFEKKYGRRFPDHDTPLIITCRSGARAQKGVDIARKVGFTNVKNYKGSWLDWAEREGLPK